MPWKSIPGAPGYEFNGYRVRKQASHHQIGKLGAKRFKLWIDGAAIFFTKAQIHAAVNSNVPLAVAPEPADAVCEAPATPARKTATRAGKPVPKAKSPGGGIERGVNPARILPLRDPWADGTIEKKSPWDWAVVL